MANQGISVVDLRCGNCASELEGREYDRVFFCTGCRIAYEAEKGGLKQIQYQAIDLRTLGQGVTIHHLPVWIFDVNVAPRQMNQNHAAKASVFFGEGRVFVPGFRMSFRGYYGDPGITLTRHWYFGRMKGKTQPLEFEPARFDDLPVCETSSAMAAQFIEPIILSIIDPIVDVTGLEIEVSVTSKALAKVAFRQKGGRIGCLDLPDEYPAHAFSKCLNLEVDKQ